MAVGTRQQLPVAEEPIGEFGSGNIKVRLSNVWYRFFLACDGLLSNFANGILGFTLDNGVVAAGATQGAATPITTEWIVITGGAINTGVALSGFGEGVPTTVINRSGTAKRIYPPSGGQIDTLGVNIPYLLANTKTQIFNQTDTNQWFSTQLG